MTDNDNINYQQTLMAVFSNCDVFQHTGYLMETPAL